MEVDSDMEKSNPSNMKSTPPSLPRRKTLNLKNIKPVPAVCRPHLNEDDKLLEVPGDGACGPNCAAAHIYGDPNAGKDLRREMNAHIAIRREFYENKIAFPYHRQVGVDGKSVKFDNMDQYVNFIKNVKLS